MFGIGFMELCVIVVVALVFVGPKKLPDLMKQVGKFFVQMRRMTTEVKSTMDDVMHDAEEEIRREEHAKLSKIMLPEAKDNPLSPSDSESFSHNSDHHDKDHLDNDHGQHDNDGHHDNDNHHDNDHTNSEKKANEGVTPPKAR